MHEDEFLVWGVGSLINCCSPSWDVMPSIFEPWYDVLSLLHQRFYLTLKLPRRTVRKGLFVKIVSRFSSKFFRNVSKSSWDWLVERNEIMKLHNFSLIRISKLMHSCRYWMSITFNGRKFYSRYKFPTFNVGWMVCSI